VKKLTLLLAAGSLWLFLAAVPVFADGGPHVSSANSGVSTLAADGCAGCHRAHTAQGEMLLNAATEEELCLTCHGAASTGATTDVMTGIQYAIGAGGLRSGTQLGALRGGGFDQARMDSGSMTRLAYLRSATDVSQRPKVAVGAAENVTSAHIAMAANGLTLPNIVWGNGAAGSGLGPVADVSCASCHNPHGNGQYRILNVLRENAAIPETWTVSIRQAYAAAVADPDDNSGTPGGVNGPIPAMNADTIYTVSSHGLLNGDRVTIAGSPDAALNATFYVINSASTNFKISLTVGGAAVDITAGGVGGTVSRISGVPVTDASLPAAGDTRNYTVMQVRSPAQTATVNGPESDYLLYASQVVTAAGTGTFNGIAGVYTATGGDYFARNVPWNPSINNAACLTTVFSAANSAQCLTAPSAPNGRPTTFSGQITQWCASCHTRYFANDNPRNAAAPNGATGAAWEYPRPGDSLFNHQHRTVSGRDCLTCHVSHGSNAAMTGSFSASFPYPDGPGGSPAMQSASSRLLKVDNRGTCQACHDPTLTVAAGTLLPAVGANTQVP
jgi:predicted CXXCH cytochrome family protein